MNNENNVSKVSGKKQCWIDRPKFCEKEGVWSIQITIRRTQYGTTIFVCDEHKKLRD